VAWTVSFLASAPGVFSSHGRVFSCAGMTAQALRVELSAWQPRVSYASSALTLPIR
jgi:hypothetical protein